MSTSKKNIYDNYYGHDYDTTTETINAGSEPSSEPLIQMLKMLHSYAKSQSFVPTNRYVSWGRGRNGKKIACTRIVEPYNNRFYNEFRDELSKIPISRAAELFIIMNKPFYSAVNHMTGDNSQ